MPVSGGKRVDPRRIHIPTAAAPHDKGRGYRERRRIMRWAEKNPNIPIAPPVDRIPGADNLIQSRRTLTFK